MKKKPILEHLEPGDTVVFTYSSGAIPERGFAQVVRLLPLHRVEVLELVPRYTVYTRHAVQKVPLNSSTAAATLGSRTSVKKAASSRENGKKGGRPRKAMKGERG